MCYLTFWRTIRCGRLYPPINLPERSRRWNRGGGCLLWQRNGSQFFLQNSKLPENEGGGQPTFCLVYHNWWQSCVLYKIISQGPCEADEPGANARFRFSVLTGDLEAVLQHLFSNTGKLCVWLQYSVFILKTCRFLF